MADSAVAPDQDVQSAQAKAWLLAVVDGTPIPTFVIDHNHIVTHWNRACELVTGTKAADVVGTNRAWATFYPGLPKHPVMADLIIDQCLDAQVGDVYAGKYRPSPTIANAWEAEDFFPHLPDGGKWLAFSASAIRDLDGHIVGAIETIRDVTLEKRALEALSAEKHHLNEIINGCSVPIFVLDKDHVVTHWNRACEVVSGIKAADVVGTTRAWSAFYPQNEQRPVMANLILDRVLDTEVNSVYAGKCQRSATIPNAWEAVDYFPHLPSGCHWLSFSASAIHDADGNIIGAIETLRDITKEKQTLDTLMEEEMRQKNTIKNLLNGHEAPMLSDPSEDSLSNAYQPKMDTKWWEN